MLSLKGRSMQNDIHLLSWPYKYATNFHRMVCQNVVVKQIHPKFQYVHAASFYRLKIIIKYILIFLPEKYIHISNIFRYYAAPAVDATTVHDYSTPQSVFDELAES